MLLQYEPLFDGTLGDWNLPPVSFEIKEGMKSYHQSIRHPADTQSGTHEQDRSALLDWCFEMAAFLTMGFTNIHQTPKRWDSPYYFRLLETKQAHNSETISDPKDQYNAAGARRFHICDSP